MEAKPLTLRALFGPDQRFVVPVFQRPYVWSRERNWAPLWLDVMALALSYAEDNDPPPHFLGAVVLDMLKTQTGSMYARQVIDGQQRLTTLQVLLCALRDVLIESDCSEKFVRALDKLTSNDDEMTEGATDVFKVWPTYADREPFQVLVESRSRQLVEKAYPAGKEQPLIVQAYRFFCEEARTWLDTLEAQDDGVDALVRVIRDKLQVVAIDLGEGDNVQVIFESLNDRGTPLQAADLVKNLLFQVAEERSLRVEDLYNVHWKPFETASWRAQVRQGRLNRPRMDTYLNHYLTMTRGSEVSAPLIYTTFRTDVRAADRPLPELMADLARHGTVYRYITDQRPSGTREALFLDRMASMDTTVAMPLLLWLFGQHDESAREPALLDLESWFVRRLVCRQTTKNYNRLLLDLLKRLREERPDRPRDAVRAFLLEQSSESGFWPRDEDVRQVLLHQPLYKQLVRVRLAMVLEGLERRARTHKTESIAINSKLHVEHLLPQSWEAHWPVHGDEVERAAGMSRREALKHTIGNLTLLTRQLNSSVSNGPWMDKRPAILAHSALSLNRSLPMAWDEEAIVARSAYLADLFIAEWPRPLGGVATPPVQALLADDIDEPVEDERPVKSAGAPRSIGQHIIEAFRGLPVGAVLTVSEIAAAESSQYGPKQASAGAITNRIRADDVPGVRRVPNHSPLSAEKISDG